MRITLTIDGGPRVFTAPLTAGASRDAMHLRRVLLEKPEIDEDGEERMLAWLVKRFRGQFTREQFLDGYGGSLYTQVPEMLAADVSGLEGKLAEFPADPTGGETATAN